MKIHPFQIFQKKKKKQIQELKKKKNKRAMKREKYISKKIKLEESIFY